MLFCSSFNAHKLENTFQITRSTYAILTYFPEAALYLESSSTKSSAVTPSAAVTMTLFASTFVSTFVTPSTFARSIFIFPAHTSLMFVEAVEECHS
jgi:hypothetical protein